MMQSNKQISCYHGDKVMNRNAQWILALPAAAMVLLGASLVQAQMAPSYYPGQAAHAPPSQYYAAPSRYWGAPGRTMVPQYAPMPGRPMPASSMMADGPAAPEPIPEEANALADPQGIIDDDCACGGAGCNYCTRGPGMMNVHGPYCDAGCCIPRWFDVTVDGVYLKREKIGRLVQFTSSGTGTGNIVLDTEDLTFEERPGFRFTWAGMVGPAANIEVTYLGTLYWNDYAYAVGTDNLYSVFSQFGTDPAVNAADGLPGFVDTDAADLHTIELSSQLDSVELSLRHRWITGNCRFQGSYALGARYIRLDERFRHTTLVDVPGAAAAGRQGNLDYRVSTKNDLVGFQLGADVYVCAIPSRFWFGGDVKAGIYGNDSHQRTIFQADSIANFSEGVNGQKASLVSEANLIAVFRINSHLSLRGGYQVLYIDGVALATENFDSTPPAAYQGAGRTPVLNDGGSVLYHGLTAGLEWTW